MSFFEFSSFLGPDFQQILCGTAPTRKWTSSGVKARGCLSPCDQREEGTRAELCSDTSAITTPSPHTSEPQSLPIGCWARTLGFDLYDSWEPCEQTQTSLLEHVPATPRAQPIPDTWVKPTQRQAGPGENSHSTGIVVLRLSSGLSVVSKS